MDTADATYNGESFSPLKVYNFKVICSTKDAHMLTNSVQQLTHGVWMYELAEKQESFSSEQLLTSTWPRLSECW